MEQNAKKLGFGLMRLPLTDRRYSIQQAGKQAALHLQEMAASAGITADEIETTSINSDLFWTSRDIVRNLAGMAVERLRVPGVGAF